MQNFALPANLFCSQLLLQAFAILSFQFVNNAALHTWMITLHFRAFLITPSPIFLPFPTYYVLPMLPLGLTLNIQYVMPCARSRAGPATLWTALW